MRLLKFFLPIILFACGSAKKNTILINNNIAADTFRIGFYNVENLFDTIDNPLTIDEEFTPTSSLHWNTAIYRQKLKNMAKVISDLDADILGLVEIENNQVILDLIQEANLEHFKTVHFESPDERGIDVALIYNSSKFSVSNSKTINIHLNDTNKTRDILKVTLKNLQTNELISVFVNHWPSRRGGVELTNIYRAIAATELKKAMDNCSEKTIAIGDFNDGPKDSSILQVLKTGYPGDTFGNIQYYNFARFIKTSIEGSHRYQGKWDMLDQMIVSKSIWHAETGTRYLSQTFNIFKPDYLIESDGKYAGNPKRSIAGNKWLNGYSDHLPIYADFISIK